jgi:hypothetical protein
MADTKLNQYIQYGSDAERIAFVPDPPQVAGADVQTLYCFYTTDTLGFYVWDGSIWVLVGGGSTAVLVFHPFLLMGG